MIKTDTNTTRTDPLPGLAITHQHICGNIHNCFILGKPNFYYITVKLSVSEYQRTDIYSNRSLNRRLQTNPVPQPSIEEDQHCVLYTVLPNYFNLLNCPSENPLSALLLPPNFEV